MSFKEKTTVAMLVVQLIVYSWYAAQVVPQIGDGPVGAIDYKPLLVVLVGFLVVLLVVASIIIAAAAPNDSGTEDERDRMIEMRGDQIGGYVLAVGTLGALWLVLIDAEMFWIAHALVVGLVLSELVKDVRMLAAYRRGLT